MTPVRVAPLRFARSRFAPAKLAPGALGAVDASVARAGPVDLADQLVVGALARRGISLAALSRVVGAHRQRRARCTPARPRRMPRACRSRPSPSAGLVELGREKPPCLAQDLVRSLELGVALSQGPQLLLDLGGKDPGSRRDPVNLCLSHPEAKRLVVDAEIGGDPADRPAGLLDHPHRTLTQLGRVLARLSHRLDSLLPGESA